MNKADSYINQGMNETVVKFEIDQWEVSCNNFETIIILDIITGEPPDYSEIRSSIFKNILPNLNIQIRSGIHFIYNEPNEIKYFKGNLSDFTKINISNICPRLKNERNFDEISIKLKNLLESINNESYINLLSICNYDYKNDYYHSETNKNDSLFYQYKKKFKNFFSMILFINCFNNKYLTFTRYCSGFARKFLNCIPIYCNTFGDNVKYSIDQIGKLIDNKDIKAIPHLTTYLHEFTDLYKRKELYDLHEKWKTELISEFNIINKSFDDKYKDKLSSYIDNIGSYIDKFYEKYKDKINIINKKFVYEKYVRKWFEEYYDLKKKFDDEIEEEKKQKLQEYEEAKKVYSNSSFNYSYLNNYIYYYYPFNEIVKGLTYHIIYSLLTCNFNTKFEGHVNHIYLKDILNILGWNII